MPKLSSGTRNTQKLSHMMERLKKEYPRLWICVLGDALYEAEPFMSLCGKFGWRYILTHKNERQRGIGKDYADLEDEDKISRKGIGKEGGVGKYRNRMNLVSGKKRR